MFKSSDFEAMLMAKEAFLLVQGKNLAPELKKRMTAEGSPSPAPAAAPLANTLPKSPRTPRGFPLEKGRRGSSRLVEVCARRGACSSELWLLRLLIVLTSAD